MCISCSFLHFQKQQVFQGWKCQLAGCNGVTRVHQATPSKVIEIQINRGGWKPKHRLFLDGLTTEMLWFKIGIFRWGRSQRHSDIRGQGPSWGQLDPREVAGCLLLDQVTLSAFSLVLGQVSLLKLLVLGISSQTVLKTMILFMSAATMVRSTSRAPTARSWLGRDSCGRLLRMDKCLRVRFRWIQTIRGQQTKWSWWRLQNQSYHNIGDKRWTSAWGGFQQ